MSFVFMQINPSFFLSQPGWFRARPYLYLIYLFKSDYISFPLYQSPICCGTTKELILLILQPGKGLGCLYSQFQFISRCNSSKALKPKHWINIETIFWFSGLSSLSLAKIPMQKNCPKKFIFTFGVLCLPSIIAVILSLKT